MIIFPMAGMSRRFFDAGYEKPKFMLPIWDGYVFDYATASFSDRFEDEEFLFIYRQTCDERAFLEQRLRTIGVKKPRFCALERVTAGQAETVEVGLDQTEKGGEIPITIFNIDTFRMPWGRLAGMPKNCEGWLEVFRGEGDNWSFVKPAAESGIASKTTEKIPISDLCCTGLYHFETASDFRQALSDERDNPSGSELYIAPIYNHLIRRGRRIGYGLVESDAVAFCGVPDEYEDLKRQSPPYSLSDKGDSVQAASP